MQLRFQLNHSGRDIASKTVSEYASGRLFQIEDLAECEVRTEVIGETKVGMIEEVEELKSDPQGCRLPAGNSRVLRDSQVGVEVAGSAESIAPLSERDNTTVTRSFR